MEKGRSWLSDKAKAKTLGKARQGMVGGHFGQHQRINKGLQWELRLTNRLGTDSDRP